MTVTLCGPRSLLHTDGADLCFPMPGDEGREGERRGERHTGGRGLAVCGGVGAEESMWW